MRTLHAYFCVSLLALLIGSAVLHAQPKSDGVKEIADKLMSADTGEIRVWCTKVVEPAKRTEANDREARMVLYNLAMRAGEDERLAGHLRKALTDTLSDKPSAPVADFMLNMLRYVADDSVVPVVAEHLSEPLLCDRACKVLVSVGSTRARDALQAALPTAKGPAQLAVVHALGELPATGAVPALLELAVSEDVEMCTAAGNALAATGDPRAQSVLLKATESPSAYRRACAAEAYLLYLRNLKDKTRATTLAIAFAKQRAGENHIQAAVLEVCSRCSAAPAVEFVLGALTHPDRRVRLAAGCALAELPQEAVGAPLGALLKTAPKATRADLLELVGERKLKGASPVVREFIAGQDVESRTAAVVALSRILGLVAVPELVKLLGDGREGVSEAAGAALLGMEDERMTAALTKAARTGTADVRAKLIGVMATRLEPGQVAAVLEFVADKDKVVAKAAATALGKLAGTADIPPFARMLGTCRDDGLRSALETSLCAVVRRVADAKVTAPPVLDALKTAEPAARPSLLKVLSVIGGKEALAAVVARLAGEDATVTLATVRAVSEWPDYSAQPALLELVKTTENTVHYVLAYRGYVRLLNARNLPGSEKLAAYCAIEELARRADEKKLVLAGMGAMKDRLALPKLLAILKDDALRNEAASAIIELARAVRGDDAVSALRKVLSAKLDSALAKRAKEAFVDITKYAGCIATWELSGPYMDRGKTHTKIYPVVFSPEKPSAKGVVWRRVMAENKDGRLNLSKVVGGNSRCVYLRCNIVVAKETAARLEVGSDDGVHVWLNGNTVHENNVPRAFIWCEDSVDVVLLEGVNTLMLKITQGGGGWEANARVQDPAGGPIEGLNFETGAPVRRALKLPQGKLADGTPTAEKLGWRMSIQCYSFRKFTFVEAIDKARRMGVKFVELFPGQTVSKEHPDWKTNQHMSKEANALVRKTLAEAGIRAVNFGVTGIPRDEAGRRTLFAWVKSMGMETICAEPDPADLPGIDAFCQEYGINVALHNHPKPSRYWNPQTVVDACQGLSKRVGACADTGHWMRSGIRPLDALKLLEGRIITFHFKDLNKMGKGAHDVHWGTGLADVPALLRELKRQGVKAAFSSEYEYNWDHNETDIAACVRNFEAMSREIELEEAGAWNVLFNMRNLAAWRNSGDGAPASAWRIDGPDLLLKGKGSYIWTRKRFADFMLELDFNTTGNSGLFFRTDNPRDPVQTGIEMQVNTPAAPGRHSVGAMYDLLAPSENAAKTGWNHVVLTAQGSRVTVDLNGKRIIDMDMEKWTTPGRNPDGSKNKFKRALKDYKREGHIGFQDHGNAVRYRNVRIRRLD